MKKLNESKRNSKLKSKKKFNSLLSTILNYDKTMNKAKYKNKWNKSTSNADNMLVIPAT